MITYVLRKINGNHSLKTPLSLKIIEHTRHFITITWQTELSQSRIEPAPTYNRLFTTRPWRYIQNQIVDRSSCLTPTLTTLDM